MPVFCFIVVVDIVINVVFVVGVALFFNVVVIDVFVVLVNTAWWFKLSSSFSYLAWPYSFPLLSLSVIVLVVVVVLCCRRCSSLSSFILFVLVVCPRLRCLPSFSIFVFVVCHRSYCRCCSRCSCCSHCLTLLHFVNLGS